jgi:hypothetical protein
MRFDARAHSRHIADPANRMRLAKTQLRDQHDRHMAGARSAIGEWLYLFN